MSTSSFGPRVELQSFLDAGDGRGGACRTGLKQTSAVLKQAVVICDNVVRARCCVFAQHLLSHAAPESVAASKTHEATPVSLALSLSRAQTFAHFVTERERDRERRGRGKGRFGITPVAFASHPVHSSA
jgi:hypothetical protein